MAIDVCFCFLLYECSTTCLLIAQNCFSFHGVLRIALRDNFWCTEREPPHGHVNLSSLMTYRMKILREFNFPDGRCFRICGNQACDCRSFFSGFYCWVLIFSIIRESRLFGLRQFGFSSVNYLQSASEAT